MNSSTSSARRTALFASAFGVVLTALVACSSDSSSATSSSSSSSSSSSGDVDAGSSSGSTSGDPADASSGDGGSSGSTALLKDRPYATTIPKSYDAAKATPLLLSLHGYSGNAKYQDTYMGLSALAEKKGFLLAKPDGTADNLGNRFWNATDACCNGFNLPVDDVAYLGAVLADMKSKYNVDPKRVFIIGHSNGAFMANRLACELAGDIAGFVSLAGGTFLDETKCKASGGGTNAVAMLQVHGDQDETVAYAGGASLYTGGTAFPGAKVTVASWAKINGCGADLTDSGEKLDLDQGLAGDETIVSRHACTKGAAELWTITGGKHSPSFETTWSETFYKFLEAHPKP